MNYLWDTVQILIIIYFWNVVLEICPNISLCEVNFQFLTPQRVGKSVPASAGTIKNPFTCCDVPNSLLASLHRFTLGCHTAIQWSSLIFALGRRHSPLLISCC